MKGIKHAMFSEMPWPAHTVKHPSATSTATPKLHSAHSAGCSLLQALFFSGFNVAWLYHWCHMDAAGLRASSVLGISGIEWRTMDIVYAQWLLARTFGHLVGAQHPVTLGEHHGVEYSRPTIQDPCVLSKSGCRTAA